MHEVLRYSSSTTMASFSSSLASQSPHPWRYDVFISFRGEDTRRSFSSHLYDALRRKGLLTFIDDYELQRGEEIAPSLVQAIQESNVAVVVFSKDYASSTWCLDELVKIIECHQTHGQIVIPVFYDVNPSHIRKQSFDVATAFDGHKQNPRNAHKIQNWRDALTMTANLSGLDSNNFRCDPMLISKIVEDISKKLKKSTVCDGDDERLVGVHSHLQDDKCAFQKFVFKLDLHDDKGKRKAMKTVASISGVDAIAMDMNAKKLTVIGAADLVLVVSKLRKYWMTDMISVGPAKEPEKKEEPKKEEPKKKGEAKKEEPPKKEEEPKKKGEKKEASAPAPAPAPAPDPTVELVKAYKAYNPYITKYYYVPSMEENPPAPAPAPDPTVEELVKAYKAYNPYITKYYHVASMEENPNACVIC